MERQHPTADGRRTNDTIANGLSMLYGIFFEKLNHAGDGGRYAELVRNPGFEEQTTGRCVTKDRVPPRGRSRQRWRRDRLNTITWSYSKSK
jgi:hypothetical protein